MKTKIVPYREFPYKKLIPTDKKYEVQDSDLKWLMIKVFPSGTMRYIYANIKEGKINVGTVGIIYGA